MVTFAILDRDYWELRSAEEAHRANPDTFPIPPREQRERLKRGQAAKLIFDIEGTTETGSIELQGERMWVIVSEVGDGYYIGILDSQPASYEPKENVYLCFGAEVAFRADHIIDIAQPPDEYVEWQLGQVPERIWPRL